MKIRSAVPENGCLIFMHYRCGGRKKQKRQKTSVKHTHSRHLAARMRKTVVPVVFSTATFCAGQTLLRRRVVRNYILRIFF